MTSPEALAVTHARAFAGQGRAWRAQEFNDLLATPHVALTGDAKSFALTRIVAGEAELLTIATDPECRREGRGRSVLRDALAVAAARGATRIFLEVAAGNDAALALYHAAGFAETGRRAGYYRREDGPPEDAITMARDLP